MLPDPFSVFFTDIFEIVVVVWTLIAVPHASPPERDDEPDCAGMLSKMRTPVVLLSGWLLSTCAASKVLESKVLESKVGFESGVLVSGHGASIGCVPAS